jgi:hypothetical protein
MELVGNTFFWTFFFMIGFVASLEIVEDLGPELMMRWFHRKVSAAVMIAVYVIAIIYCLCGCCGCWAQRILGRPMRFVMGP